LGRGPRIVCLRKEAAKDVLNSSYQTQRRKKKMTTRLGTRCEDRNCWGDGRKAAGEARRIRAQRAEKRRDETGARTRKKTEAKRKKKRKKKRRRRAEDGNKGGKRLGTGRRPRH